MTPKTYYQVTGVIFAIFGLMHIFRLFNGWEVEFAGWEVPMTVSYIVPFVAGYLAYTAFTLAGKAKK